MAEIQDRKVFRVFNQEFIVEEPYTVTKELGQGAYGIVWQVYLIVDTHSLIQFKPTMLSEPLLTVTILAQRCYA